MLLSSRKAVVALSRPSIIWDGYEARHNVTLWLVQLRPNDLGCGRQKVISLFLRDIGISLD
jgi:hypothetical protein